ncbi:hypothetical protein GGF42_004454 [Coemansia sp. RSA 2424]|nr:hypothetical protein GGF42_004454 [Coemansia sp. RSA 2424]
MASPSQRSTLVPAEFPLACGSAGDEAAGPGRPGVTYSTQTVRVPSDRRLIMIPASIPIPLNNIIAAVLFAPPVGSSTMFDVGDPSGAAPNDAGPVYDPTTLAPADDPGTFVQLNSHQPPAEPQSLAERGRSVVAALIRQARMESQNMLPTVEEELSCHYDEDGDDEAQADYGYIDDDALAAISEIGSDALTIEASTPQLPHQVLSTAHTSPEASSGASAPARGSKKRQREEPEATDADKPKKPRNSFFYFRREYHKQTNANGGRTKAKNISGLAGKEWSEMTESQKEPYKQFAAEDTVRYKQEMKAFKDALKRGKKKAKVERPSEAGISYGILFDAASSRVGGSHRSTPANGGLVLSRLEPIPMLSNMGNPSHNVEILSYLADMPVEVAAEFEYTPGLFNDSMILSVNPDGVLTTDMPAQPDFVPADYSEHAIASGSMGPPPLPPATSAQYHPHAVYHPAIENQLVYGQQQHIPDHNGAYVHIHTHQQFEHPQLHDYPQVHHHAQLQQHHWGDISSLLDSIDAPAISHPFSNESLLTAFSQSGGPPRQSAMPELMAPSVQMAPSTHAQAAHIDQAMAMLNARQLNTVATADPGAGLNEPASTSEHLTGMHPSIPDIELVDASNSITLPTYYVDRRR